MVAQWAAFLQTGDVSGVKTLWAADHEHLTYLPTVSYEPKTSWSEISDFYDRLLEAIGFDVWKVWDIRVDVLSRDVAYVWCLAAIEYVKRTMPGKRQQFRCNFCLIKQQGAWRIAHYEDSTQMQYMIPIVQKFQSTHLDHAAAQFAAGNIDAGLAALRFLKEPILLDQLMPLDGADIQREWADGVDRKQSS